MKRRAALAGLLVAALVVPAVADARRVRVFAVGPKFDLSWVDTRAHYHDKLFALFDRRLRGRGAPTIQAGADDVASHLPGPGGRALVALPEDLGLMAIFTGERGQQARQASDLTSAIAAVLVSYGPVSAYYSAKYPSLSQRPFPPTRLLAISATDTFARVAVETFAELAARYHVYLEAGVNMAESWQVVCTDRATFTPPPGASGCDEQDPAKVMMLRAPDEPDRDYAYEATSDRAVNMALLFGPDGHLVSKQVKTYLTPTELPGQLDLAPGAVSGLGAVRTPVGTLGFVTSKDAWMPDVTERLDEAHVDLLVQPEFFVGDTVKATGMWAPDNIKASGFSDVLRHPSFDALLLPELTGNVYDFSADNQQAIAVKPRTQRAPRGHLVGQRPAPGYAAVQDWVVPDPLPGGEPMLERRRRLAAAGEALLPKQGNPPCRPADRPGPCRGGQVEGVLWRDVDVGVQRRYHRRGRRGVRRTAFSPNRPLAPAHHVQRNVVLAARDGACGRPSSSGGDRATRSCSPAHATAGGGGRAPCIRSSGRVPTPGGRR